MNRPIKFRACYLPTLKMFDMEDLIHEEHLLDMLTMVNGKSKEEFSPLMQFTGLYDCNNVEIYEDDIVEIKNHPFGKNIAINGIYRVRYDKKVNMTKKTWSYVAVIGCCMVNYLLFR
ncbi:YopX family protein [Paenibacillus larvae]|uniref:YopX family protein n=1 Tax=Paenibacillus larvae TaxID=1464 RepID=UPI00288D3EA7|nr:YopX family protein [Paenibacillus larvae]MDT2278169.1 YopX family protein [Paenibacillus larvae]